MDATPSSQEKPVQPQIRLTEVEIVDENVALNVIISFLSLAQKRGAFTLEESSKIWDCVKKFHK